MIALGSPLRSISAVVADFDSSDLLKCTFGFLCLGVFIISLMSSYYAPGYSGVNRVAEVAFWPDSDPGAWYLQSAHELSREPPVFFGHPGLPLKITLSAIQKLVYFAYRGADESYTACIIRKLYQVQLFSRIFMTVLWLLTAWMVKLLAHKLFDSIASGYVSAILFLTSYPFLHYINRIAPEPFMMFFFVSSFYFLLHVRASAGHHHWGKVLMFACAAAAASIAAFYSKIHLFGPFPVFICFFLAFFLFTRLKVAQSCSILLLTMLAAAITIWFFEFFMDWSAFTHGWTGTASDSIGIVGTIEAARNIFFSALGLLSQCSLIAFLPFTDFKRFFFGTEYSILLLFLFSFFYRPVRSNGFIWIMALYVLFPTYIAVYRADCLDFHGFHYFFPLFVVCCIQAAWVLEKITSLRMSSINSAFCLIALVAVLHFPAVLAGIMVQTDRIENGRPARAVYQALSDLRPGESLARDIAAQWPLLGLQTFNTFNLGEPSLIETELERLLHDYN